MSGFFCGSEGPPSSAFVVPANCRDSSLRSERLKKHGRRVVRQSVGLITDEQDAAAGERQLQRRAPGKFGQGVLGGGELRLADEQRQAAARREQGGGQRQALREFFHGAEGDYVSGRRPGFFALGGVSFGAAGEYIDVGQCESAGDFFQESSLLVLRF